MLSKRSTVIYKTRLSLFKRSAIFALAMAIGMPVAFASASAANTAKSDYEAKKAAYRALLMADKVTCDDLLIGSWVSFYSFEKDSYEYQLDQMAAAGINFNIYPKTFGGSSMRNSAYWNDVETQYAKRNMLYLMNGGTNQDHISLGVEYANGKEHCIGYRVKDEPTVDELMHIGKQMRAYRQADPTRYPFTNLLPSYASSDRLGGSYRNYVEKYVEIVGAENVGYLSHDYYPFRKGTTNSLDIFSDMEVLRSVAYENGKLKTHAFPQSSAWDWTRMPNIDEMRWNAYAYLAYGFKALSWFNLVCPGSSDTEGEGFYDSLIYRDGTIRDQKLFNDWSELNWEIRGLSSVLMKLDTVHAYHVKTNVNGVEYLPASFFLQPSVAKTNDFIVSHMESKDGKETYIMLFNKELTAASTSCLFNISASEELTGIDYFDPNTGEYVPMDISNGKLQDDFKAGEGKLYRLNYPSEEPETTAPESTLTPEDTTQKAPENTGNSVSDTETTSKKGCASAVSLCTVSAVACTGALVATTVRSKRKKH